MVNLATRAINRCFPVKPPLARSVRQWVEETGVGKVRTVRPEVRQQLVLPASDEHPLEEVFINEQEQTFPERYLAIIPDVSLRGPDGFVILPDGCYSTETAPEDWMLPHPAYRQRIQTRPKLFPGRYFSLLSIHCREFYHWLLDVLPRLYQIHDHLPPDIRFLIPHNLKRDQQRCLERVGLAADQLQLYNPAEPVQLEELWYSPLSAPDRFDDPAALQWLRSRLWPKLQAAGHAAPGQRIFISRDSATTRRCLNEADLDPLLRSYGFTVVRPELLSLEEQISLFANAEVVLGAHGAGFTNVLFCKPGTKVFEIFPERVGFRTYYWSLATACGLDYGYTKATSVPCEHGPEFADMVVDPEKLRRFLDQVIG